MRTQWLNGITKDLERLASATQECSELMAPASKTQYLKRFRKHDADITKLQESLGDPSSTLTVADMHAAKALVENCKKDIGAFNKLKDVYGFRSEVQQSGDVPRSKRARKCQGDKDDNNNGETA